MMFDPQVTLLAREVSIKFAGSFLATASYGAFANTVAPVIIAVSMAMAYGGARRMNLFQVIGFTALIMLTVFACLISGTKGLMLPSLVVILVSSSLWNRSLLKKSMAAAASLLVLFTALMVFEVIRDRRSGDAGAYPFGYCSAALGACDQSVQLIRSLYEREFSLGLFNERIAALRDELFFACSGQGRLDQSTKTYSYPAPLQRSLVEGVIYRAFVIPAQVAAWHYLYVEEYGTPGFSALPFARRLTGSSVNMPELVYQKYGSAFSEGDRTSTSTSPTGFLLAYPAYLGFLGLAAALMAVMVTDVILALLLNRLPNAVYPIGVGLTGVMAFNFTLSDFVTVMLSHGGSMAIALMAFFTVFKNRDSLKRTFDVVVAVPLALALAIPLLILGVLVRVKLGAPVLFKQKRPGLNGELFNMLKFRTMTDARDAAGNLLPDVERLTPFGRWLRSTSLDELPELINVIRGQMSLVGPRPLLPEYLPLYTPEQARRHEVRPGITGWAQINGRNALSWKEKFALDVWYVDNRSFLLDLRILAATALRVLSRKGVNAEGSATAERFRGS